ncbi:unnamed protein product [Caenorhabditis nigoni]
MATKEIGVTQYYMIHYRGRNTTTDIEFQLERRMEECSSGLFRNAWENEKKGKRKAVDDLETSLEKKENIRIYSVFEK